MGERTTFDAFIAHQNGCVVVVVRGEVDMAVMDDFTAVVDQALAASPHVVFDMVDVTFLDSCGLRVLALAVRGVGADGSVTVRNSPAVVSRVLRLSGLDQEVIMEPAADTAL
jgi:anti-anti-sigma factor